MKSNVSDHLELVHTVYSDVCAKCPAEVSDLRDLLTVRSRVKKEGLSFLTITLPEFCKDFERSLALGFIDSTLFRSFRKNGAIPAFLRGMLSQLFDRETGRLLDENPEAAIYVEAVRQFCLFFKKILLPCTPERENAALQNFKEVEQINKSFQAPEDTDRLFLSVSSVLWDNCLGNILPDQLVPRHGPGATAERITGNRKFVWQRWHERLEVFFPFLGSAISTTASDSGDFRDVTFVPVDQEQPVRVTLVPKTLKSPRIIAIEPVCMQYIQQAIRAYLYDRIESYWLTRGHVSFTRQTGNQRLAKISSRTGRLATIDLSDASDRVPRDLALRMLDGNPELRDAVDACRSIGAELPSGEIISPLYKFASMGSALCFPIEAMYFYTICVMARLVKHNLPPTPLNIFKMTRRVFVYGDDIVVPTDDAGAVLDYLRKYNCKVNDSKTFVTGKFRESCGVDAYDGEVVTPIYLRRERPRTRQQVHELISWIATANLLYLKGCWRTASHMFTACEKVLGPLPYVSPDSSVLGRISLLGYRTIHGWNDGFQAFTMKAWKPAPIYRCDRVDGYAALQKCLISLELSDKEDSEHDSLLSPNRQKGFITPLSVDKRHLEHSARRGAVTLKHRWVPVT